MAEFPWKDGLKILIQFRDKDFQTLKKCSKGPENTKNRTCLQLIQRNKWLIEIDRVTNN